MTEEGKEDKSELLAEQWLGRSGLLVQIDRGFKAGRYGVVVQFEELAGRVGFAAAHRKAEQYCALLKEQFGRATGYTVGRIEDASREVGPGRKRDLESTFLAFRLRTDDGQFHDADVREQFRLALLRTGQAREQVEAREQSDRRSRRQEVFRERLADLLNGPEFAGMDLVTKVRLLDEVPGLAFPAKGREL